MISRRELFRRAIALPVLAAVGAVVARKRLTNRRLPTRVRFQKVMARPVREGGYRLVAYSPASARVKVTTLWVSGGGTCVVCD
ncbi:hypothetical protein LCGC14_0568840 [marine sediment metagenome]|uniref:Uncharacterized protein n=1 Tax=marine sediment metagenome TaxID=412755 RepID=A0A0F9UT57_9ZZZZ|nr:hypothetical protein [Phycisphaerae bacterium]